VLRGTPEWIARRQFDAIADAAFLRQGKGVRRLATNLRRVLGDDVGERELRRTVHRGVRSYLRYWREVFQLPRMSVDEVVARSVLVDDDLLRDGAASGDGMVIALPHIGNWDWAGAWLAGDVTPFTTVAERLEPASLFDRFVEFREGLGMEVVPLTGGERPPYEILGERLRSGGTLALLGDRDLTATGMEVQFFGRTARMPAGPAALAVDTGARLVPLNVTYPDQRRVCIRAYPYVQPPAGLDRAGQIAAMTQSLADVFAGAIKAAPHDWHMLQRVWVEDLT
jgi:KDO2-lipid IV(A) lauroyltransferase